MINRKYKDTVFRMLFGSEEYKENTLALYNAMNGSHYTDPAELEINTIQDVIYMGAKNDTSFIIGNEMNLWEHQSSFNPNMPLRGLSYFAKLYEGYVTTRELDIYGRKPLSLPTPRFVVFYIGSDEKADVTPLRLSDLFYGTDAAVEVTATMININYGRNESLMKACRALEEYSVLVHEVRTQRLHGVPQDEAVKKAVDKCINAGVLREFLLKHKAEVTNMFLTEWDEEKYKEIIRRDAFEEGREEGRVEGRAEGLEEGLSEGRSKALAEVAEKLMKQFSLPREKVEELLK